MALIPFPNPMIFAHRGASAHAPENTLPAFHLAYTHHADGIELDVKLTKDGEVIVMHDQRVDRTTDGTGDLREFTLADLKKLDAGAKFNPEYKGTRVPLLAEVFEELGQKLFINVELTNYASSSDALPEKVAVLVHQYHLEKRVIFSSFNPLTLRRARRAIPEVPQGILALEGSKGALARSFLNGIIHHEALHPYFTDVTPEMIRWHHDRGMRVHPWTIDPPEEIEKLFQMHVDGVITDDPALARQVLNKIQDHN
jgi:glycerophosphoryl diester phosphodiesterase